MKKQTVRFGLFLAGMTACILGLGWLVFSLIAWDFSISPVALRALVVVSALAYAVGFVAEKWFI
jgi:hypothetical protein